MTSRLALSSQSLQQRLLKWPEQPPAMKIDTHHHYVPDFYAKGEGDSQRLHLTALNGKQLSRTQEVRALIPPYRTMY
jgi:hypothetical protein